MTSQPTPDETVQHDGGATADAEPRVQRNDAEGRYEILVGDELAGFTEFAPDAQGRLVFPHTEIDDAFAGAGLAKKLVAAAMTDVASRGETVVPRCSYVIRYLARHEVPGLVIERAGDRSGD